MINIITSCMFQNLVTLTWIIMFRFWKKIAFAAPNMANLSLCKETEDGMILREKYPGGRQPTSVFWAIVQPLVPWWMVLAKL